MDWRSLRIVAFDTETTGLNPYDGDRVMEFAAVELFLTPEGQVRDVRAHDWLINPGIPIPPKVVQLTGITDDAVSGQPPFEKRAAELVGLLAGAICIAHNFPFDRGFIAEELRRLGRAWPDPLAEIDTVDLSMKVFPQAQSHKLGDLAKRLGVTLEGAHRATNDAEACGRCFVEMTRREHAPTDLHGLLDWADALGEPPPNGVIGRGKDGVLCFTSGPYAGEPVERHPLHMHWMLMAVERVGKGWRPRFPESLRRWCERFLKVRGAGRARQGGKGGGADEWGLDSNALPLPEPRASGGLTG